MELKIYSSIDLNNSDNHGDVWDDIDVPSSCELMLIHMNYYHDIISIDLIISKLYLFLIRNYERVWSSGRQFCF